MCHLCCGQNPCAPLAPISCLSRVYSEPKLRHYCPWVSPSTQRAITISSHSVGWTVWHVYHDDVIKWKHFPRYWPFVRGIHRFPVNSPHKGQWRGALIFSLICVWINGWVYNREAGDWRRYRAHFDISVMILLQNVPQIHVVFVASSLMQRLERNIPGSGNSKLWHHYCDIIMSGSNHLRLYCFAALSFVPAQIKEYIKTPRHWLL